MEKSAESIAHGAECTGQNAEGIEHGAESKAEETENLTATPPDLPPEFCHYRDEGCEMAESCLECPFPKCIYDEPGGKQRWLKRKRAKEITRLHIIGGKKVKELAEIFGVSERTVQRDLREMGKVTSSK